MFTKILVPLDGSERAERAIPVAARMARASSASILLVRVVEIPVEYVAPIGAPMYITTESNGRQEAVDYLKQVKQCRDLKDLDVKVEAAIGSPAATILEIVRTLQADLVVMCSHGYTGVKHWILGSVAERIARHTPVPTLILREHGPTPLTPIMVSPIPLRALVPLDGSKLAEEVLAPMLQLLMTLAPETPKELHLLRVVSLPSVAGTGKSQAHLTAGSIAEAEKGAMDYLVALTHRLQKEIPQGARITISSALAIENDVAGSIIKNAEGADRSDKGGSHVYDIIGMATHARSIIPRWVMGSVTESVLHHTTLPLLVVSPGQSMPPEETDAEINSLYTWAETKGESGEFPAIL